MDNETKPGRGRCSVGTGGPWKIDDGSCEPGCQNPSHLIWLPKGFGPCEGQFMVALVARPFDNPELDRQLAAAVAQTIEKFIWDAARRHRPVKEPGWMP